MNQQLIDRAKSLLSGKTGTFGSPGYPMNAVFTGVEAARPIKAGAKRGYLLNYDLPGNADFATDNYTVLSGLELSRLIRFGRVSYTSEDGGYAEVVVSGIRG